MFDFQKLEVYQKAKTVNKKVFIFLAKNKNIPFKIQDQLLRAVLSVVLNIAEGAGRFTNADKKHYYVQARATGFETVAALEVCYDLGKLLRSEMSKYQKEYEEISKMLFAIIRKLHSKSPVCPN